MIGEGLLLMHNVPLTLLSGDHPSSSSLPLPFPTLLPGALHSSCSDCSSRVKEKGWGTTSREGGCLYLAETSFLTGGEVFLGTSGDMRDVSYSFAWMNGGGQMCDSSGARTDGRKGGGY